MKFFKTLIAKVVERLQVQKKSEKFQVFFSCKIDDLPIVCHWLITESILLSSKIFQRKNIQLVATIVAFFIQQKYIYIEVIKLIKLRITNKVHENT